MISTLVANIKETTEDFSIVGKLIIFTVLAIILACSVAIAIGLILQVFSGTDVPSITIG